MLPRLARYAVREAVGLYALGIAAVSLLLAIDFLSIWASFLIDQQAPLEQVGALLLLRVPQWLHVALPVAGVFAVLLATGRMARDSELKAAYAGGVRPRALILPLALVGLGASALAVGVNGWLEPMADERTREITESFYRSRPSAEEQTDVAFRLPTGDVAYAARVRRRLDQGELADLRGVLVVRADGATVQAPRGVWDSGRSEWILEGAEVVAPDGTRSLEPEAVVPFELPTDPGLALGRSADQTLGELAERLEALRAGGGDAREVLFAIHRRLADASSAFVFVLVAASLGLTLRGRSGGFAWTIALMVLFWVVWVLGEDLFDRGVLGPVAAAWATPLAALVAGAALAAGRLRA